MLLRWGSKLVTEGEITLYQFIVSFMGVFFSSQGASTLFTFASSKSHTPVCSTRLTVSQLQASRKQMRPQTIISGSPSLNRRWEKLQQDLERKITLAVVYTIWRISNLLIPCALTIRFSEECH